MTAMAVTDSRRGLLPGQYTARYARARGGREQGAMEGTGSNWGAGSNGRQKTRVTIELHVVYFITIHTACHRSVQHVCQTHR
jgi:hypothetical protein